jgi:hypothetical protein
MKDLKLYINEKLILKKTLSDPKIISLKKENEIVLIDTFEIGGQYHDVDDSDAAIEREWDNFTRYTLDEIEKTYDYFLGVNLNDIKITKSNIQSNITNLIDYVLDNPWYVSVSYDKEYKCLIVKNPDDRNKEVFMIRALSNEGYKRLIDIINDSSLNDKDKQKYLEGYLFADNNFLEIHQKLV